MNHSKSKTTKITVTVERKYAKYIRQSDLQDFVDMIIKYKKGVLYAIFSNSQVDKFKLELTKYPNKVQQKTLTK